MGFWENLTGNPTEGLLADKMPEKVKLVHSVKNHLQQLINIRRGTDFLNPDMGINDTLTFLTKIPPRMNEFAKSIKDMILKHDKRVKELYLYNWHIEKKLLCPVCKMIVVLDKKQVIRYSVVFGGVGKNLIHIITGEEE
jgi:hypothetical protein